MRLTTYIRDENCDLSKTYIEPEEQSRYPKMNKELKRIFNMDTSPILCLVDGLNGSVVGLTEDTGLCVSLEVPESECHIIDFYNWTDYMYFNNLSVRNEEQLKLIEKQLKTQKPILEYNMPQVIISRIEPEWVKYVGPAHNYAKNVNIVKEELVKLLSSCMSKMKELKIRDTTNKFGTIMYMPSDEKHKEKLIVLSESGYFLFEDNKVYGLPNPVNLDNRMESFNVVIAYAKISLLALILNFKYLGDTYGEQEFLDRIVGYINTKYHQQHNIQKEESPNDTATEESKND